MEDKRKKRSSEEAESNIDKADLDALMLDSEDDASIDSPEEDVNFEAFMAEYRNLMSQGIEKDSETKDRVAEETEEDFLISPPPKKKENKKQKKQEAKTEEPKERSDWDEEITLAPEEYEELDDGNGMRDELPEDEPKPDFNLGETAEEGDDKFQLSINFEGEQKPVIMEEAEKERKYDPENPRAIDWVFDIAEMFVFVLAAVMILTSFLFKHSVVEGDSMLNTLEDGDHLIISDTFYTPKRGDIVVFEDYSTMLKKAVVKRVIGLPGETVEVKKDENGNFEVYINGEYLDEEYAYNEVDNSSAGVGVWTVGEGEIFVMGDNRYNSTDSRDNRVGTVDIDSILGKVMFRFYPFDKFGAVD